MQILNWGFQCFLSLEASCITHHGAYLHSFHFILLIARAFLIYLAWSWLQSGINTDGLYTSRRVQKGAILSLNCFPMIAG